MLNNNNNNIAVVLRTLRAMLFSCYFFGDDVTDDSRAVRVLRSHYPTNSYSYLVFYTSLLLKAPFIGLRCKFAMLHLHALEYLGKISKNQSFNPSINHNQLINQ